MKKRDKEYYKFYPIDEFPDGMYEINKMGQVRNQNTKKLLKATVNNGYLRYTLLYKGKIYARYAHILVARQFLKKDNNTKNIVNHIDEDRTNPCVDNLEWVTHSENSRYGTAQERARSRKEKPINEYTIDGEYLRTWKSAKSIANYYRLFFKDGYFLRSIYSAIKRNSKTDSLDKISLFNKVFIPYEGSCENMHFNVIKCRRRKLDNYSIPDETLIPVEMLYTAKTNTVNEVLSDLLKGDYSLTKIEKTAIKYALSKIPQNMKNN